jgi:hypothetical protein
MKTTLYRTKYEINLIMPAGISGEIKYPLVCFPANLSSVSGKIEPMLSKNNTTIEVTSEFEYGNSTYFLCKIAEKEAAIAKGLLLGEMFQIASEEK